MTPCFSFILKNIVELVSKNKILMLHVELKETMWLQRYFSANIVLLLLCLGK